MQKRLKLDITDIELFKSQVINYGNKLQEFAFLDSNNFAKNNKEHNYYEYDFLAAIGSKKNITGNGNNDLEKLNQFVNQTHDWIFGFLTYDLKNELETLESKNNDLLNFPELHFFIPEILLIGKKGETYIIYDDKLQTNEKIHEFINVIKSAKTICNENINKYRSIKNRIPEEEYLLSVKKLKHHIQRGDIYEVNFCQEFYSHSTIDPVSVYLKLREISPTPFSCYYKLNDKYLISASPERFLKKTGSKIISQPIKGTIKRGNSDIDDQRLKEKLSNDPKEIAENVMIVDLVRNDLSRTAKKGSVKVEELFGIYTFRQVHQMISTVVSEVEADVPIIDIIKNAFPMGSMTGAPKVRAMELIEQYEKSKRGLYSGSVGYITPEKDFDFNVVIRSILYNKLKNYVSFTVGGAITSLSDPEKEYEECMVKAQAMLNVLNH